MKFLIETIYKAVKALMMKQVVATGNQTFVAQFNQGFMIIEGVWKQIGGKLK
jgi:hypothetical protein